MSITPFVLDALRLPPETLDTLQALEIKYQTKIDRFHPDLKEVESYIQQYGIDGFYKGQEEKNRCCFIRKVAPIALALAEIKLTSMNLMLSTI